MRKLIRDKIGEMLLNDITADISIVKDKDEHIQLLKEKLVEEATEVLESTSKENLMEEIGDLAAVATALLELAEIDEYDFSEAMYKKEKEKGIFEKGYILGL